MSGYDATHSTDIKTVVGESSNYAGRLDSGHADRYYLSEPYKGGGLTLNLKPGEKLLDRFTIQSGLGQGSFSTVYLAYDDIKSAEVALKVVPITSEAVARQLRHEIDLYSQVHGFAHVVRVYDIHATTHKGVELLLVSMEYAEGGSFRQWLKQNKKNIHKRQTDGLCYFKQACRGVHDLHNVGIVHQDLKPENLLFVKGVLKVADLSLSRCIHNAQTISNNDCEDGTLPGTPAYMSPDQIMAAHPGDIDGRSDIYSLGVIAFEICHPDCRPPFGGSYHQICERHLYLAAPALENAGADVARVVARCLQKNACERYATVTELLDDLEGKANVETSPVPEDGTQQLLVEHIEGLWERACHFVHVGDLSTAGKLCRQILNLCPGHEDAKSMLEEIEKRYQQDQQFYRTIEKDIGYQSLDQLSALLTEAVEIYPGHPDGHLVQTQLVAITREYKDVMDKGMDAFSQGRWQEAQNNFERAQQLNPGVPTIIRLVRFLRDVQKQIETTRNYIDTALVEGEYRKAMYFARELDRYVEDVRGLVHRSQKSPHRLLGRRISPKCSQNRIN